MNTFHHLRAWLLKRQVEQLLKRANDGVYRQSARQTGGMAGRNAPAEIHRSGWFAMAALTAAFGAGYVVADDKRIERDQQDQVSALCEQKWPDAPGATEARRRACPTRKRS